MAANKEQVRAIRDDLADRLRGPMIGPQDADYEEARAVYNAMIDRRPELIIRCADVGDVVATVKAAAKRRVPLAVRGGGHHAAGLGVVDGGLVLDLSLMKGIRIDQEAATVRVEAGCTWGEVDHATHPFGLAAPGGVISTTGVAGLTLGGGSGYLSRRYGLSIDNLISADVVLADGSLVTADEARRPDLFWALRGGGGNFGVVTSFEFRLHPVSTVVGGPTLWPFDQAGEVLRWYREFSCEAPAELYGFLALMTVPPAAPFPAELHGQKVCGVVWCYSGDPADADAVFAPVRSVGKPALHGVHELPFPALQSAFDGLYPPGLQWYWRGDFFSEIPDEAIDVHLEHAAKLPTLQSMMHLYAVDGAPQHVAPDATAFSYREANWNMVIGGVDPDPGRAGELRRWTVDYQQALHPFSLGGAYVNFLGEGEGHERVKAAYRDNYDRLTRIKAAYDPYNLFRYNQNIPPSGVAGATRQPDRTDISPRP